MRQADIEQSGQSLQGQHAAYIERQLAAFAQGIRRNDIYEQMRAAAKQLTPGEMQALAAFYGMRAGTQSVTEVGSP
jgi:cytochrome c553